MTLRQSVSQAGEAAGLGAGLVYIADMTARFPVADPQPRAPGRWIIMGFAGAIAVAAALAAARGGISLEAVVAHRDALDALVAEHLLFAVLGFICLYIVAVGLSVPGAWILTVTGGFLFGLSVGTLAAVIGATGGAAVIFLLARTALGEPLLRQAGPRAKQLAEEFCANAFSYLLFLRLVPAFPFCLVNLVPAFVGMRLLPFVAATAIGVIPAALVFAYAGTGLDSVIAAQKQAYQNCLAAGLGDCHFAFGAMDILTPQLIGALIALGLLALVPVLVRRLRAGARAAS